MIGIRIEGDVRGAADAVAALPEVDYLVIVGRLVRPAGRGRRARTTTHLLELLNDKIRTVPGVASTDTFTYLKICKETYSWGTR